MGDQQEDGTHYHARIQTHIGYQRDILLRHESNILLSSTSLVEEWGWGVEVLPQVVGQRSARKKEWLEVM